jgi:isopenicillin-N epimerase
VTSRETQKRRIPEKARPGARFDAWTLDPDVVFLNHGSFGAAPRAVLEKQLELRALLEREPVRFFVDEYVKLLEKARAELAAFVGADTNRIVFVPNATTGVNTALRSLQFKSGDELVTTDHEYNACRNALEAVASKSGASIRTVSIPFPCESEDRAEQAILDGMTDRTRLLLIDHITSQTALVLPVERLVPELENRGIKVLIDGAHAPGMKALNLDQLGASFYTGNCHKWMCSAKGAAFLYVKNPELGVRPLVISHGANEPPSATPRLHQEFDWVGTSDPTPVLSLPTAIRFFESILPGGWTEVMGNNHRLASKARRLICDALGVSLPCPESMIGSMAAIPLPPGRKIEVRSAWQEDPLQRLLFKQNGIEVPIISWPAPPSRLVRISAQLYNQIGQYEWLADALLDQLGKEGKG